MGTFADFNAGLRDGVADEADQAAAWQLADQEAAILQHRLQTQPIPQLFTEDGESVLCWECANPIPLERLAVHPQAAFCVPCLEQIEKRQKQEAR